MRRSNTNYVVPIKSTDGVEATFAPGADATLTGRGVYTLASGTTYFYMLGPSCDASYIHAHLQGDAALILTSVTVEDCDADEDEVTNINDTSGAWLPTPPAIIESAAEGAGWTQTTDVLAVTGGAVGGASWNIANQAARRMRLKVVVGATGGEARLSSWAKE
jgi:hypothetical protein